MSKNIKSRTENAGYLSYPKRVKVIKVKKGKNDADSN